ncbi:MAG: hypothetical protein PHG84_05420 [Endomicrobiaceae bacterium]|nr:hypothetical protein [Endomicrobiaceae bacterium]
MKKEYNLPLILSIGFIIAVIMSFFKLLGYIKCSWILVLASYWLPMLIFMIILIYCLLDDKINSWLVRRNEK